jgi:hypothetical protein
MLNATARYRGMVAITSTLRSDGQLEFLLHETANWTVNGGQGAVLCEVASLRLAAEKAVEFALLGREVVTLMRRRSPEIIVLSDQVRILTNHPLRSRGSFERRVAVSASETTDQFDAFPSVLIERDVICLQVAG